ncbi:VOC family protein [Ramlibacter humi]|uniref:VOC family protein n=1 Tax=Ramlibacter humi TaxID=2530451 RepID=A0A4Z0BIN9_9BURK|nr:VOC family protein [Ramlibacter humi]TFY98279.1 VOC family protein [Ramlibacter humi]
MTAARIDHLVIGADTLAQGAAWSRKTLGAEPNPGGQHPLMGTHNQLMRIATVDFPCAYLEIIAHNPPAQPQDGRARWFDLDQPAVKSALRDEGPRLIHWVVKVPDLRTAVDAWAKLGIDRGEIVEASRMTPRGLLQWQITIRRDGQRLLDGCLPTLIQWGETHPAHSLPESGVTLRGAGVRHPQAALLAKAFEAIGLESLAVKEGPANLCAALNTPGEPVRLQSKGL